VEFFWSRIALSLAAGCLCAAYAGAGIGPENVAVVVNGDSPDSLCVANAYARLRGIPPANFIVLHHLTGTEFIAVDGFRKEILQPVLATLRERGLTSQIDCIAYSVDLPYSIDVTGDVKGRRLSQVATPTASINGLTYLSDWVLSGDIDYLRLDINRYARHLLPLPTGKELSQSEQSDYAGAVADYSQHKYGSAIQGLKKLLETPRSDPNIAYNLACCQALAEQPDDAVASLRKAIAAGWRNYGQTASDPDLNSLHDLDGYKQVLRLLKAAHIQMQEGTPFHHAIAWNRVGEPDRTGSHYMLSTVLGVTAGRGNTLDEILASLGRSLNADFTAPKGTIYFERNGDVRSTTREWGFQAAADELERLGVKAIVEDGVLPQNRADVAGAMIGISDFNWPSSHSTILPGAICEHFTSFGGMINKGAGQTACTEFIRNRASGTSGTVTEPYALQEKFPTPFIQVEYAKGFTLAESFYQSLSGPYQLLIIGDPLCRPWAKKVEVKVAGVKAGAPISGVVRIRPSVSPSVLIAQYKLFVDGKLAKSAKPGEALPLDSRTLGEGYHELTVVAERSDAARSLYRTEVAVEVPGKRKGDFPREVDATLDGVAQFQLSAKGASTIELFSLGASIGRIQGDHGSLSIKGTAFGQGVGAVYAVATYTANGKTARVAGSPIAVHIAGRPGQ